MSDILVHNPTGDAQVYTTQGRRIGPHRTVPGDSADTVTSRLLHCGRLLHMGHIQDDDSGEDSEVDGESQEPAGNASTQDWADYAVGLGYPEKDIAELKRHEIQELVTDTPAETTPAGGDQPADEATAPGGAETDSEEEN